MAAAAIDTCKTSGDLLRLPLATTVKYQGSLDIMARHSKLYCLCSRDIQNFIVCAIATFKTLLFVQTSNSKLFSLRVPSGAPYRSGGDVKQVYFFVWP